MVTTSTPARDRTGGTSDGPPPRTRTLLVGIVADPGLPTEIAHRLAEELPGALAERSGHRLHCRVVVVSEELSRDESTRLIDLITERRVREGWDFAVCLTDLPLETPEGQLVADLSTQGGAAVIATPALSMIRPAEHARDIVVRLLLEWAGELPGARAQREIEEDSFPGAPSVRGAPPDHDDIDLRVAARASRLRQLAGMVWINRPWRLVLGLRSAMAAALATAAFGLVNNAVWQLSGALSTTRLVIAMVASLVSIVAWLIVNHNLWQHPEDPDPEDRRRVRLFNAATVLTLAIGVTVSYIVLLVGTTATGWFVVVPEVLSSSIGRPAAFGDYVGLGWLVASLATVGGALGSGLESSDAVRSATYGARDRYRRAQRAREA
ncbi:hypothetical protein ACVGVM_15015 [Pseudonocardia bannensis]|uniref:5,10-methylene-tetrahydrofolate dehydrogenase n=1 Tax=Pseudonocardia bannensis TaxID=630973 RepID=A0A848DPH0_9PSEU|nr:hypothetical protein [Pseudonocardia bannensis]NMH94336.1 hypothetical protein [Pseudonocardia bannensis]